MTSSLDAIVSVAVYLLTLAMGVWIIFDGSVGGACYARDRRPADAVISLLFVPLGLLPFWWAAVHLSALLFA